MRIALPPPTCKVYTPPDLAQAIVNALGDAPKAVWLEPSHGKGAFIEAVSSLGVNKERIIAIDLDRTEMTPDRLALTSRGVDFLRWASTTQHRFDRIIGNPPFISIAQLPSSLQRSASAVCDFTGEPIGKGANLWYAFVLASLRLLRKGGCLGFVLPSAAEFADYSAAIRQTVVKHFEKLELYRCTRPLFDDVQEGTVVALARGYELGPGVVSRRWYGSRSGLIRALSEVSRPTGRKCPVSQSPVQQTQVTFGSIATIRLGGVTGDSSYFLMNEKTRTSLHLPTRAFTPVVSKSKHLHSAMLTPKTWGALKTANARIWLFNPTPALAEDPAVKRYLGLAPKGGGCNRSAYKISIREVWYRTPMQPVPDGFLSGMSQYGPWICLNETRLVNATNTLYVVRFASRDVSDWYMWALAFLTTEVRRQLRRLGRRYPDGLIKYEPGSLCKVVLPKIRTSLDHKHLYIDAVDALLTGKQKLSKEIADSALD